MPRPRNERIDSNRITPPTASVVATMIGEVTLGRMWRQMIRLGRAPSAPAAASAEPIPMVSAAAAQAAAAMSDDAGAAPPVDDSSAEADNLQKIKGIGPKIAGILGQLGIRRFEQIAAWTPENVAWVNDHLKFKGRIEREEWIPQAKALIAARDAS